MGLTASRHATLTTTHDIPAADLALAYNNHPSPTITTPTHPSDTPNTGRHPTHRAGKYIALDTEMVGGGDPPDFRTHILARVSLVNFAGQQLYDSYVVPPAHQLPVRDYRTAYSGIQPHHLRAAHGAREAGEVRAAVAELLRGRVLVGHALRNDLRVLELNHPGRDTRDTSLYAPFRAQSGGKAPALRVLAERELGWRIQVGSHSSVEDARAAMMVFRKVKAGLEGEVRRRFGRGRTVEKGRAKEEDDEGEEDSASEDEAGEEADTDGQGARGDMKKKKKKRKKTKKRTKRK